MTAPFCGSCAGCDPRTRDLRLDPIGGQEGAGLTREPRGGKPPAGTAPLAIWGKNVAPRASARTLRSGVSSNGTSNGPRQTYVQRIRGDRHTYARPARHPPASRFCSTAFRREHHAPRAGDVVTLDVGGSWMKRGADGSAARWITRS